MSDEIVNLFRQTWPDGSCSEDTFEVCCDMLLQRAEKAVQATLSKKLKKDEYHPYAVRLAKGMLIHISPDQILFDGIQAMMESTLNDLESGNLAFGKVDGNLVRDIVLAEALGRHEEEAAKIFEIEFMPMVRSMARRTGGEAALSTVDNLAADLILPRKDRTTKISTYLGKTLLKSWLKVLILNLWYSDRRRVSRQPEQMSDEPIISDGTEKTNHYSECDSLLQEPMRRAAKRLDQSDRALLKMLILDGAPQVGLARMLKVPAWQITRRKQRASTRLYAAISEETALAASPESFKDCLQLVLAGDSPSLRSRVGEVLATSISGDP